MPPLRLRKDGSRGEYGCSNTLTGPIVDKAPARTTAALKAEGFGVQHAMRDKVGGTTAA